MPQLLKLWLNQNHQSLENAISADRATVDEKAYKAHLETPHFKKYKVTTKDMVKSLKLVETTPIFVWRKIETMKRTVNDRVVKMFLIVTLLWCGSVYCNGQSKLPPAKPTPSIESLNLVGAAVTMPLFSDTMFGADSDFRRALFSKGLLFRINALPRYSMNVLDGPVPANQQVYIGQRPTFITGMNAVLTADLRQLGLHNAQLNIGAAWRWTTWNPAGPKTISLTSLSLYKMWGKRRVEMKAGYLANDNEFVGMQVGGSTATAAQGVYAVLPFQVGMSYFPLSSPSLNFRIQGPKGTYVKIGAQRSLDAAGGQATQARNQSGFRFMPKGDKLLLINEIGYQRASSATAHQVWFRAGYMHNSTEYTNKITGKKEAGNYATYALLDYQLRAPDSQSPGHGLFIGGSVMTAPARFNSYVRYYEARLYQKAPFRSRPDDVASLVAAYRDHSKYVTDKLVAQGKTVWENSPSITGSYSLHVTRGNYLSLGAGYVRGAAITPRVADALTLSANWGMYF